MKILGHIEVKKTSREEFEAQHPKHIIDFVDDRPFMCWCNMCPEPIYIGENFVFIDEDNKMVEVPVSNRKAHAFHLVEGIDR